MHEIKTQQQQMKELFLNEPKVHNDKIKTPNINTLHLQDKDTVLEVLQMVCKSRNNIVKIVWVFDDWRLEPVGVDYNTATSQSLADALYSEWVNNKEHIANKISRYFEVVSKKVNPF
jgi:hypothetical protein